MRTVQEIVEYCRELTDDLFGFQINTLLWYIPFDDAKEFLIDGVSPDGWNAKPLTREQVVSDIVGYLDFAWDKCRSHRGLSAGRSIEHMRAWIWLLGDEFPNAYYENYGAPILKAISEKYGFPVPEGDDVDRMSKGMKCYPECDGCGASFFN